MAKQISELTNKATPVATDEIAIQETGGSTTKKATAGAILGAGLPGVFSTLSASGFVKFSTAPELTIASGAVTATTSHHIIDTEGDASTDDLDTINGGSDYALLILQSASTSRVPTLKDGTGNLVLAGDFALSSVQDRIMLIKTDTAWVELARSNNA